jgi:hypothetical protein
LRAVTGLTVIAPVVVGVTAVVVLAGCGGPVDAAVRDGTGAASPGTQSEPFQPSTGSSPTPSGLETRSAAQLVQAARDAFAGAPSVHITGTAVEGADAYVLDARLAGEGGGTATVETSGQTVDVTRIGQVAYVGGDVAFWRSVTGNEAKARQMVGSHVRTRVSDPNFAVFVAFTRPSTYLAVLPAPGQPATLATPTKIRGAPVVGVLDAAGSTVYVAASGPAYPVRLDGLATGQVVFLDFSDYSSPVQLRVPSAVRAVGHGPGS